MSSKHSNGSPSGLELLLKAFPPGSPWVDAISDVLETANNQSIGYSGLSQWAENAFDGIEALRDKNLLEEEDLIRLTELNETQQYIDHKDKLSYYDSVFYEKLLHVIVRGFVKQSENRDVVDAAERLREEYSRHREHPEEVDSAAKAQYQRLLATIIGRPVEELIDQGFFDMLSTGRPVQAGEKPVLGRWTKDSVGEKRLAGEKRSEVPSLPAEAPCLWVNRTDKKQSPVDFIRSVYEPWLNKGLTRGHLNRLDHSLYVALRRWLKRPENELPADIDLPEKREQVDRDLQKAREDISREEWREWQRLERARRRRDAHER